MILIGGPHDDLGLLRRAASNSARLIQASDLDDTFRAVAEGLVATFGFAAVTVHYLAAGGALPIRAVAESHRPTDHHHATIVDEETVKAVVAEYRSAGPVRMLSGHSSRSLGGDVLVVVLHDGDGTTIVGALCIDLSPEKGRPAPLAGGVLELFAAQAGVAIDNARLAEALREEHIRLQASEAAFRFSFSESAGAMVTVSLNEAELGRILQANHALCRALGYTDAELVGRRWTELVSPDEKANSEAHLVQSSMSKRSYERAERRMVHKSGTMIWAGLTATVITPGADQPPFLLIHLEDITQRKLREATLLREAHLDELTGLPNRRALISYLDTAVGGATQAGPDGVVVYADLDHFKHVNDRYGHATGDIVLRETAQRLKAQVRATDLIARHGGDEFVIVAMALDRKATIQLIQRINQAFSQPLTAISETIGISLGFTTFDAKSTSPAAVLHEADLAMYADKRHHPT